MRVLFWSESFWPHIGGVSVISSQYIVALQARGYDCLVVTSRHRQDIRARDDYHGISIYRFPFSQVLERRDVRQVRELREQILTLKREFAPDVIHFNECGPSVFFHRLTASVYPVPTVMTIHSLLPQTAGRDGLLVQMLGSADWVGAVSRAMLDDVRALSPQVGARSSLTYNGLALPAVEPLALSDEAFAAPCLLCVGRVVYDKGFDLALTAFAAVTRRFPHARLIIAGDGDAREGLQRLAVELGVSSAVEFIGWAPPEDVPALMNSATLVIMPSRWREPFGLVALQAAQMARAVVAMRVGGLPEIVVDRETGLLVANEDSAALADAITFLLEHPHTTRQMGCAARQHAQSRFTLERLVEQYEDIYRHVLKSK
ncbi:MAG: glycosyltransferase family 4 protein [Chloroflexi bacterium]|nr:glycosyltransferase family 4 protein [Chloroflexota bacterium]